MFSFDAAAEVIAKDMKETFSLENVVSFHSAFCSYNFPTFEEETFKLILKNFTMWYESQNDVFNSHLLSCINLDLMKKLLQHEKILVKNKLTLYIILKKWLEFQGFKITANLSQPFLETEEGKKFKSLFSAVTVYELLDECVNIEAIKSDNIYPLSVFENYDVETLDEKYVCCADDDEGFELSSTKSEDSE